MDALATIGDNPSGRSVAVCVPVRDERAYLGGLLDGLAAQDTAVSFTLCLLFDGCDDGGETYVRDRASALPFDLRIARIRRQTEPNAGRARRAAMALGERVLAGAPDGVLLSTDADSVPAPNWIGENLRALRNTDVVAGYIARPDAAPHESHRRLEAYWSRLRSLQRTLDPLTHDPAPSHACQGGASLGFSGPTYAALGGFAPVPCGEDERLITAARRAGLRVCHDRHVQVATSSRTDGRARHGLADTLRRRSSAGIAPRVEDPDRAAARFHCSALARRGFADIEDDSSRQRLAIRLRMPSASLLCLARRCSNAEAFTMLAVPEPARDGDEPRDGGIALPQAEIRLAALEAEHRCPSP